MQPVIKMVVFRFRDRDREQIVGYHRRIVDGLASGDGKSAAAALNKNLHHLEQQIVVAQQRRQDRPAGCIHRCTPLRVLAS